MELFLPSRPDGSRQWEWDGVVLIGGGSSTTGGRTRIATAVRQNVDAYSTVARYDLHRESRLLFRIVNACSPAEMDNQWTIISSQEKAEHSVNAFLTKYIGELRAETCCYNVHVVIAIALSLMTAYLKGTSFDVQGGTAGLC